jgi:hypothetical protein
MISLTLNVKLRSPFGMDMTHTIFVRPIHRLGIIFALLILVLGISFDLPSQARYGVRRAAAHRRAAHRSARHARHVVRHQRRVSHQLSHKIKHQKKVVHSGSKPRQ